MVIVVNRQTSDSFYLALLLTVSGGFLESYTYISRDGVFANAQTGNLIKLAMGISDFNYIEIIRYSLPIIAFVVGIIISCYLRSKYKEKTRVHWRQIVLAVEVIILLFVCLIPIGNLNAIANILVSLTCAMQYEAFKKFEGNPFSSLFCTGNANYLKKCQKYLSIIMIFMMGVIIGDIATVRLWQYACIIPSVILVIVIILMNKENIA